MVTFCSLLLLVSAAFGQQALLWRDPGSVTAGTIALVGNPKQAPKAPFRFLGRDESGTTPKIVVADATGRRWVVKWGSEVKAEVFASRLVSAVGYYTEPVYFVSRGRIRGVRDPGRAGRYLDENGAFRDARFELRDGSAGRFMRKPEWTWKKNPFLHTRQLNGLKMMVMLTSNWDNKDPRDDGSNTGILERGSGSRRRWIYLVTDWGGSMGKWGNFFTREKWDCEGFAEQSSDFVKRVEDGEVKFGFTGKHDDDFKDDIRVSDVRWLMRYLGRVSDTQIRAALRESGATPHETRCFTRALRSRINQLRQVANMRAGSRRS